MATSSGTVSIDELINQLRQSNMSMVEKAKQRIESLAEDIEEFERGLIEQDELNEAITEEKRKILALYAASQDKSEEAERLKFNIARTQSLSEEEFELLAKYENLTKARKELDDRKTYLEGLASPTAKELEELDKVTTEINNADRALAKLETTINSAAASSTNLANAFNGGSINSVLTDQLDLYNDIRKEAQGFFDDAENSWKTLNKEVKRYNEELRAQEKELKKLEVGYDKTIGWIKKIWSTAVSVIKPGIDRWKDFNQAANDTAKSIAMNHKSVLTYQKSLMEHSKRLAREFGLEYKQIVKIQDAYANATNRAALLSSKQIENVAAISKLVGEDTANTVIENMDKLGGSVNGATSALGRAMAKANSMGLNAVKASAAFAKNMSMVNKYSFKDGVEGVSKMTMLAQKLKFDLQSAGSVIDKFSTIEGAIETSANLQMMGGEAAMMFSNPMESMSMALNNPEQLIEKMTKAFSQKGTFNKETGQVDIVGYNLQWIKKTAEYMGMNAEEAVQIAKQTKKIDEIDKQLSTTILNDKQLRSIIESKAEYNEKTHQFEITYLDETSPSGQSTISVSDIKDNPEILKQLREQKEPVEDIQMHVRKIAMALTSTREKETGFKEAYLDAKAQHADWGMRKYDNFLTGSVQKGEGFFGRHVNYITDGSNGTGWAMVAEILLGLGVIGITTKGIYMLMAKNHVKGKYSNSTLTGNNSTVNGNKPNVTPNGPNPINNPTTNPTPTTGSSITSRLSARGAAAGAIGGAVGGAVVGLVSLIRDGYRIEENNRKREEGIYKIADSNSDIGKYMKESGIKSDAMAKILEQQRKDINNREIRANTTRLVAATTTGAMIGAAIGSVVPGVGTAVIGAIGAAAGAVVGGLTIAWAKATEQIDERDALDMAQEDFETAKFGATSVNDPILAKKRDLAVLGMHDLLISIWYHLNGQQSNGAKETSFWGDFVLGGATFSEWWNDSYKKNEAKVHSLRERGYVNGGNEKDDLFVRSKEGTSVNYAGARANEGDVDSETPKKITINPTSIVAQDIKKEAESGAKPSVVVANENETVVNKEKITNLGNAYNELVSTTNAAPIINHKNVLNNNQNTDNDTAISNDNSNNNISNSTNSSLENASVLNQNATNELNNRTDNNASSIVNSKISNQNSENYIDKVNDIKNGASKIIIDKVRETSLETLVPMFNKITSFIGGDVSNVTTSNGTVEQYPLAQVTQLPTIGSQTNTVNTVPSVPNYNIQPPTVDIPKMDMTINITGAIDLRNNGMNNGFKLDAASLAKDHPEFINSLTYILMDSIRQKMNGGGATFGQRRS